MCCPRGLCPVISIDGMSAGTVSGCTIDVLCSWTVPGLSVPLMGCPRGLCMVGSTDGLSAGTVSGCIH